MMLAKDMSFRTFLKAGAVKCLLLALGLLAFQAALGDEAGQADFSDTKLSSGDKGISWVKRADKLVASVGQGGAASLGQGAPPTLDVDATAANFPTPGKSGVTIRFYSQGTKQDYSEKKVTVQVDVAADRPAEGLLFVEGQVDGKHFWKALNVKLPAGPAAPYLFSVRIPPKEENLQLRFDCLTPAVYRFSGFSLRESEEVAVDPDRNWITNGGAEMGWYGTSQTSIEYKGIGGKILFGGNGGPHGAIATQYGGWVLDDAVFHGGKRSFRSVVPAGAVPGSLTFNPVPYVPGKPASFSVWLKAEKPNTAGDLSLFLASGIAYAKTVVVGTEWRKYDLTIPSWGGPVEGGMKVGDVVTGYGCVFEKTTPRIQFSGTVWADDAAYSVAPTSDFKDDSTLWLRGHLDKAAQYYRTDEKITATVEVENATDQPETVDLSGQTLDFYGQAAERKSLGTVELAPHAAQTVEIPVDTSLLGPVNFVVEAQDRAAGKAYDFSFYLVRITPPGAMVPRLGFDLRTQQNMAELVPFLNDFRIGTVRLWSDYDKSTDSFNGVQNVPVLKKAGVWILFNVGFNFNLAFVPRDFSSWQAVLKKSFAPVSGMIDCYEIMNEPNIWSGRGQNPDPNAYEEMDAQSYVRTLKAAVEAIREVDPHAQFGGPTSCHTDVGFTDNALLNGAAPLLDIITEHPYRETPELPDYETDLINLKQVIRKDCGRDVPMMGSEGGFNNMSMAVDNRIDDTMRDSVALSIRNMLIGFANGSQRYVDFQASLWPAGTAWHVFYAGSGDNQCSPVPNPVLCAMRTLADHVGMAPPLGRIKLGADYRCYVFDRGDARVVCLWKWHGDPATLNLKSIDPAARTFDVVGNEVTSGTLRLDKYPVYLETSLGLDQLQKNLDQVDLNQGSQPFATSVGVSNERQFSVGVLNRVNTPLSGQVDLLSPEGAPIQSHSFDNLAPEEMAHLTFDAPQPISTVPQVVKIRTATRNPAVTQTDDLKLRAMLCPRTDKPLQIDGDLSDWPAQKPVVLTDANAVMLDPKLWTEGDKQIKAEIRTAWDDDYLYVAVTVDKPVYFPNAPSVASLYLADSLQIAFDPLKKALEDAGGYDDSDFEYALGVYQNVESVYRIHASSAVYDSLQKNLGQLNQDEVKLAVKSQGGKTVYEMAFSRVSISPFRLAEGASMRWDVIANLNNGAGRMGWLELTPGIGKAKNPGTFMDIFLVK